MRKPETSREVEKKAAILDQWICRLEGALAGAR
jgi:hypothetical protein